MRNRDQRKPTSPTPHPLLHRFLPPLLLILAGVLAYWNSFDGVFVYDDIDSIRDNPHIRMLWPLSESMSLPLWNGGATVDGRPLLSLSFALNHWLFGPEPWGYHLVNLLIHIAAGLLLFGIVRRTLALPQFRERYARSACPSACPTKPWRSRKPWRRRGTWLALVAAAIWLVHPLQTESVTYIVQRAESLMGMLFLLTMYCAIRGFASEKGGRWYVAAIVACAVGMGVKEIMFSAPILVILYDYIFNGGLEPGGLALPAKAGQAASLPRSAGRGLQRSGHVARARRARGRFYAALFSTWLIVFGIIAMTWAESTSDFVNISPVRYALTQPLVLLYYLRLAVWPSPLVLSYGWGMEDEWLRIVLPGLAILGLLGVMFRGIRHRQWYGFVLAWFFLILAPTSSVAPMRQSIFEHRMYLSLAAVVILAVVGGEWAIRKLVTELRWRALLGACLVMVVVTVLGYLTHDRNRDYHDELVIWRDNVAHQPRSHLAQLSLGNALQASGRVPEAIVHHEQALRIKPDYALAHNNLGNALFTLGRVREAIPRYRTALRIRPAMAEAHYNWGLALQALGQLGEAIAHYEQALQIKPDYAEAHNNTGTALLALGRPREAVNRYDRALQLKPDYADAHNNLASAMLTLGWGHQAIPHLRESLRLKPGSAEAHYNWGLALEAAGRPLEAIEHYRETVRINPELAPAHNNLGNVLLALGRHEEAIRHFEQAVRLKPDYAVARKNLRETRAMLREPVVEEGM
ncbi:MAG: tetratricopeptide repeat protein [Verrucomicrobia bacterium]|jgi:protein O-mannosyl-transferase|nr:tetratricopeptide repeat protein [Verrucomicrobiota bacterium]MBT7069018.1 tetratricopeptide repeat protein [Verrucomicrobiota bacterium]MBT7700124.1 tetratricopeptide repeat protein [Verrucomicrobiota bacterium]